MQLVVLNTFYNVYKLHFQQQGKKNFDKFFDKSVINKLGKSSGFVFRTAQKITRYHFVLGFLSSSCKKQTSFSGWAMQTGMLSGNTVSRQALFERIHEGTVEFAKSLVKRVLLAQSVKGFSTDLFAKFKKVLLQDSTTLRLPQVLSNIFPGNHSRGAQKAVARIQGIIDIKAMKFIDFVLAAFTQNDQSASGSIIDLVKKGDLVIRDLGYFAIGTFEKLLAKEVDFLSRLKYGVGLYDENGSPIRIKDLMKQKKPIDRWVFIGAKKQIWVRLVMLPLPAKQVAEKIRKAKQDRDKRLNHSTGYYQWLGYSVYITSVKQEVWTAQGAAKAYRVRWQIEIIFKSWKTGFHMQEILHEGCTNQYRVKVSIYLLLLFMCLFMQKIDVHYRHAIEKKNKKIISIMKLANFIGKNFLEIFLLTPAKMKGLIIHYCCYEKRNDRINMTDLYQNFEPLA